MKKLNFIKISKIILSLLLVIVVAGAVLAGVLGFNKGVELSNGYELTVKVDVNFGDNKEKIETETEKVLKENGVKYDLKKIADEGSIIIYQFKEEVTEENTKAFEDLAVKVEDAVNVILVSTTVDATTAVSEREGFFGTSTIWWAILAVGVTVVLAFIYLLIRYNIFYSLVACILAVFEVILLTSLVGLVRIPLAPIFSVVALTAVILSFINTIVLLNGAKEKLRLNKTKSPEEVANELLNGSLPKNGVIAIVLVVASIVLMIIGGTFTSLAFELLALAVVDFMVNQFAFAPIFLPFERKRNKDNLLRAKKKELKDKE
ncbi:MAG: hypothetical protein IKC71_03145 [Clostridia bacterium]|nr:hypothetical protein [Clostridia bacterium]